MVTINLSNKLFYSLIVVVAVLVLGVSVWAFGGTNPSVMGHSAGEIVENDPTVLASVKNGVSWDEVTGKPSDFSDGVDNKGTLQCTYRLANSKTGEQICGARGEVCMTAYLDVGYGPNHCFSNLPNNWKYLCCKVA